MTHTTGPCAGIDPDGGLELFPELTAGGIGAHLVAPRFYSAENRENSIALIPVPGAAQCFRGPVDSPVSGIEVNWKTTHHDSAAELSFSVVSGTLRRNVQLVQPLRLGLDWKSYVIAPGALYNGNRFIVSPQPYCPYLLTEGVSPDGPIVVADVPRLTADKGYTVEFAANAFAIPAVGLLDTSLGLGFIIGFDVYGPWGVTGVNLRTLPGEPVTVDIALPVMRRQRYQHTCHWIDTEEHGMDLEPGKPVSCRIRIIPMRSKSIPALISRLAVYGYERRGQEQRRPILPLPEAAELVERKHDLHYWSEKDGYYCTGFEDSPWRLQTGWVGGGVTFCAMAHSVNQERRRRALRMMDVICRNGLSPSGYFHGLHDGKRWRSFGVKRPGCRAFSLIRRPLECTRDVLKTISLLQSRGENVDAAWENAARRNLDAMVKTTERYGHLGYTVDFDTGDVLWGDTCCGAFGIEPLVRGAAWFNQPAYLKTATRLAEYYVERFLFSGFTCGGVGDALMAVDSESNYALLAGLMQIYAATADPRFLEWSRLAADLFATWVLHYDAILPPDSPLGRLGIQPRGAVFANIQNQHGAPGICTASGVALLKLYEATGEERYLRLLEDIAQCIPQMVVRAGQEKVWGSMPIGSISERLMTMDGLEPCGHTAGDATWCEAAMLLTAGELPSVYYDNARGLSAVFDVFRGKQARMTTGVKK